MSTCGFELQYANKVFQEFASFSDTPTTNEISFMKNCLARNALKSVGYTFPKCKEGGVSGSSMNGGALASDSHPSIDAGTRRGPQGMSGGPRKRGEPQGMQGGPQGIQVGPSQGRRAVKGLMDDIIPDISEGSSGAKRARMLSHVEPDYRLQQFDTRYDEAYGGAGSGGF